MDGDTTEPSAAESARSIFSHLDSGRTGYISSEELESVLPVLQANLLDASDIIVDQINEELDLLISGGDGRVSEEQFVDLVELIDSLSSGKSGGTGNEDADFTTPDLQEAHLDDDVHQSTRDQKSGISRQARSKRGISSVKLRHLRHMFDEIASTGNGAIGDKEMSMLLKDDIVAGKSHMASVKRKGGRGRQLSIRHSGNVGENIVRKLRKGTAKARQRHGSSTRKIAASRGSGLGFDDFKDAFQDMIDDNGESIRLPKIVRAQMQALNEEIRSLHTVVEAAESKNNTLRQQHEAQRAVLEERLAEAQQAMVDAETERDRARAEVANAGRELRDQAEEIARRSNVIDELEEALHATRATRERAPPDVANDAVTDLEEEIAHLTQENRELQQDCINLEEELSRTHEAHDADIERLQRALDEREQAHLLKESVLEQSADQIEDLRAANQLLLDECEELKVAASHPVAADMNEESPYMNVDDKQLRLSMDTEAMKRRMRELRTAANNLQGSLQLERNGHGGESSSDFVDLSHAGVDFFATNDPEDETEVNFADIIGQFGDEYDKLTKMVQQKAVALKESESKSRSVQLELDGVRGELSIRTAERDALQTEVHRLRVELAKQCQNTGTSLVVCVPCMLIPGCRTSNARFTMGNFHPFHDTDLQPWWCASSEWRHRAVGVVRIAAVLQIHARLAPMLSTANPTIRWLPTMAHMQRCTTGPRRCRRRHLLPRWRHRAMNPSNGA
eukprot:m.1344656 g.1344656  ORF g.1344656 m.1344656 type:complete len:738 (+) comp24903_c1_seq2:154-2367(+)